MAKYKSFNEGSNVDQINWNDPNSVIAGFNRIAQNTDNSDRADAALQTALQVSQSELQYQRSLPEEQIKHLMSTGMSRAAAIQALQGTEFSPAQGSIAGNVEQSELQKQQFVLDTIQASISLIQQGVQIGIAVPSLITQVQSLQYSSKLMRNSALRDQLVTDDFAMQKQALASVAQFQQYAWNYKNQTGEQLPSDLNSFYECIVGMDMQHNPQYAAFQEQWNAALKNPYFYAQMQKAYTDMVRGDYSESVARRIAEAGAILAEYNNEEKALSISNSLYDYKEKIANRPRRDQTADLEIEKIQEEISSIKAGTRKTQAEAVSQEAMYFEEFVEGRHAEQRDYEIDILKYKAKSDKLDFEIKDEYITPIRVHTLNTELDKLRWLKQHDPDRAARMAQDMMLSDELRNTMLSVVKIYYDQMGYTGVVQGNRAFPLGYGEEYIQKGWSAQGYHPEVTNQFKVIENLDLLKLLLP